MLLYRIPKYFVDVSQMFHKILQPRSRAIQLRFRTCTSSSDEPGSPIRLLFQLPSSLSRSAAAALRDPEGARGGGAEHPAAALAGGHVRDPGEGDAVRQLQVLKPSFVLTPS